MSRQPTVSACLIVKNEAANLPRCLASLRRHVDEIVVIDTGSTDETLEVTKRAATEPGTPPLRLGDFAWTDDFAAARNAALALATSDWVLVIDADEELVVKDVMRWRKALAVDGVAYGLRLANVGPSGAVESEVADALRLFPRRPEIQFEGRLHESVERTLHAAGLSILKASVAWIRHHGYQPAAMAAKAERNRHLAEVYASEHPEDPLPWLYTAQSAWLARDAEGTLAAVEQAHKAILAGGRLAHRQRVGLALVETWARLARGEGPAADALLAAALAEAPNHPELRYERGRRRAECGDVAGASEDFTVCLRARSERDRGGATRTGVTGFLAHVELMGLCAGQGDMARAAKHAAAAAGDPDCPYGEAVRLRDLESKLRQLSRQLKGR